MICLSSHPGGRRRRLKFAVDCWPHGLRVHGK